MEFVWPWIDASIYCFVPLTSVTMLNAVIICKLKSSSKFTKQPRQNKKEHTMNDVESVKSISVRFDNSGGLSDTWNGASTHNGRIQQGLYTEDLEPRRSVKETSMPGMLSKPRKTEREKARHQATLMCIMTSVAYCLCTLPIAIWLLFEAIDGNRNGSVEIFMHITATLSYVNHAINFYLYCFLKGIRREIDIMVKCRKD